MIINLGGSGVQDLGNPAGDYGFDMKDGRAYSVQCGRRCFFSFGDEQVPQASSSQAVFGFVDAAARRVRTTGVGATVHILVPSREPSIQVRGNGAVGHPF